MLDIPFFWKSEDHRKTGLECSRPGWPFCIIPDSRFLRFCSFLPQAPETPRHRDYAPHRSASALLALWPCFLIKFNLLGSKLSLCFPILPTRYRQQIEIQFFCLRTVALFPNPFWDGSTLSYFPPSSLTCFLDFHILFKLFHVFPKVRCPPLIE